MCQPTLKPDIAAMKAQRVEYTVNPVVDGILVYTLTMTVVSIYNHRLVYLVRVKAWSCFYN